MNYSVILLNSFRRDLKTIRRRGYDLELLYVVTDILNTGRKLPVKHRDHNLVGKYKGCKECHIPPDWLLIYEIKDNELVLILTKTGTHSDLF